MYDPRVVHPSSLPHAATGQITRYPLKHHAASVWCAYRAAETMAAAQSISDAQRPVRHRLSDVLRLHDPSMVVVMVTRPDGTRVLYTVDTEHEPTTDSRVLVTWGAHVTDRPYRPGLAHRGIVRSITRLLE